MNIFIWKTQDRSYSHNLEVSTSDIVIVYNQDFKILKKLIKKNILKKPNKLICLKNNTSNNEEDVIFYINNKYSNYELFYDFNNKNFITFKEEFIDLVKSYNKQNMCQMLNSINSLIKKQNFFLFETLESIVNYLNIFYKVYYLPLIEYGVKINKKFQEKDHNWLSDLNDYINYIEAYKHELGQLPSTSLTNEISIFLNDFLTHIKGLVTSENKILFLSFLFLKMSNLHYLNKNFTLSYVLTHRALDLFLQYECFIDSSATIRSHTWKGMSIQYDTGNSNLDSKDVTINNSLKVLDHQNIIQKNSKYSVFIKDFFNENRNLSYLAHGIYSITEKEAKIGFKFLENFFKYRLGKNSYNMNISKIFFEKEFQLMDFIKDDKYYLETFFSEHTLN